MSMGSRASISMKSGGAFNIPGRTRPCSHFRSPTKSSSSVSIRTDVRFSPGVYFSAVQRALWTSLVLLFGAVGTGAGQYAPPGTGGVAALADLLRRVGAVKRVLVIGAHPDDEDTQLLS